MSNTKIVECLLDKIRAILLKAMEDECEIKAFDDNRGAIGEIIEEYGDSCSEQGSDMVYPERTERNTRGG